MPTERSAAWGSAAWGSAAGDGAVAASQDDRSVVRAPIQLNLTAAGWAVVALLVASLFMAATSRLAVGFMVPLFVAVVADLLLSWHALSERHVSIAAMRTVAHRPDGIPLRISLSGPRRPIRIDVSFRGGIDEQVVIEDGSGTANLRAQHTGVTTHVRCSATCTLLGLGIARRWQANVVPMLHWAPAPSTVRLEAPTAIDEVARLRTYEPGDRMSRVSWPITARTGQLHVRAAGEGYEEYVVVVNLEQATVTSTGGLDTLALETTLELAATLVTQLLEDGHQVRLLTTQVDVRVHDEIARAARDNPRLPPVLPDGASGSLAAAVVDGYVTGEDELARRLALAEPGDPISWPYGTWVDVSSAGIRSLP